MKMTLAALAAAMLVVVPASAATTIDFSTLANGTAVTNQYSGVIFSLQGGPQSGGAPTTYNYSGEALGNSTSSGYPTANILDVAFTTAISALSFTFNNYGGNATTYTAYGANNAIISTGSLANANDFNQVVTVGGSGITDLKFDNHSGSNSWYYAVQKLTYSASAVPEPATWVMMIGGFGMVGASLRRRRAATAIA